MLVFCLSLDCLSWLWLILMMIIDCFSWLFFIEFWLSWMIVFESYVDCLRLIAFDDFFYWVFYCLWWLCLRVMLIIFDDCFLLSFWLSWMIVFERYVDCLWLIAFGEYFLIEFLIVFDDCVWELCWLSLMIAFDDCFLLSFDCFRWLCLGVMLIVFIDYFWWLFLIIIYFDYLYWICIFNGCKIVSFKAFWYHLILIHLNKR